MPIYGLDPLQDPRWEKFLGRHPQASVFHTPGWLEALRRTYGYEPFVVTTAAPGEEMRDGIVFCRVKSWLTGNRAVSLPFADHCQPLVESPESLAALIAALREEQTRAKWKYIELRPLTANGHLEDGMSFGESAQFHFHRLDLRPDLDSLYRGLHKSCVQRKIRRAARENLEYEEGRSEAILAKFYHLLLLTRRRHRLPPQPRGWFRNLLDCAGDGARIHVASKDGRPIASILTLFHKQTLVYKYGCSDSRFHRLGGMPLLFWKAIQEGRRLGAREFDLGRSETDNPGLAAFKGHLGATCSKLTYFSYPPRLPSSRASRWKMKIVKNTFGWLPDAALITAGRLLYRHVG
ncbi:MAG TPA: GNAT family N-acetyltransferase [Terriglobia bacterium]|nr:GNAT family N-acetyltransferase [Terriglobia bacterium]